MIYAILAKLKGEEKSVRYADNLILEALYAKQPPHIIAFGDSGKEELDTVVKKENMRMRSLMPGRRKAVYGDVEEFIVAEFVRKEN